MKKQILTIIFTVSLLFSALPAMAATSFSFSPITAKVTEGNTFSVAVTANPYGLANYTTKMALSFPADLLEVKSFNMGGDWMPLNQAGYNLIDNTNGSLIKTGGYAGGYTTAANFGTITFLAKKAGTGVIKVTSDSISYDADNKNVMSTTLPQVAVTIWATPVKTPVVTTPVKPVTTPTETVKEEPTVETPITEQPEVETPAGEVVATQPSFLQASLSTAYNAISNFKVSVLMTALLILIAFILGYFTRLIIEKRLKWKK
jgi:hypothetical protein